MAIKMAMTCTRCHREDNVEIQSVTEATALEEHQKKKDAALEKLKAFVENIPPEDRPDFFAIYGDKVVVHSYLCTNAGKRSCEKRVADIIGDLDELGPRSPRTKKPDVVTKVD